MANTPHALDLPRGFRDVTPDLTALYRSLQQGWFSACALAGHRPVQVPPIGFAATFTTGHHAGANRTYTFADRGGRELALVSDSLPTLLRFATGQARTQQRLSYCCPVFRYERRPRRAFHHLGVMDVTFGELPPAASTRCRRRLMQMVARFLLRNLDVEFTVADPGLWHELLDRYTSISDPSRYLNEIRKVPRADRASRLLADGIPMPVVDTARRLAADRTGLRPPALSPSIAERAAECERFADAVRACGATAMVDLHDLHASEFHDGPAFTVRQRGGPLLGDGGSYGQYATRLTGRTTTAHSVVIGLERLADLLHAQATNGRPTADVALLIATDPEVDDYAENLVWELRDVGLKVWDITIDRALSHHLRSIAELRIPYSIIVGARELRSTDCAVRDLAGQIRAVPRRGLAEWLRERAASGIEQPT